MTIWLNKSDVFFMKKFSYGTAMILKAVAIMNTDNDLNMNPITPEIKKSGKFISSMLTTKKVIFCHR